MANLAGTAKINLSYQAPGGGTVQVPQKSSSLSYSESSCGTGAIPAGTVADDPTSVPFGTIATASGMYLVNNTTQVLNLKINGGSDVIPIAANGGVALVQAALTSATLVATATGPTADPEPFDYFVFGDAV